MLAEVIFFHCFHDQGGLCANHNICGLAHLVTLSLVIVKEKIIKRTTWQWQEQISCNRRTITILHIQKKIIPVLFWQDHCVIVCCTTHTQTHTHIHTRTNVQSRIGVKFLFLFLLNYPSTKFSNVSICFIWSVLKPQFFRKRVISVVLTNYSFKNK